MGNGWREHTEDDDLHTFDIVNGVGLQTAVNSCRTAVQQRGIGLVLPDDVGPQKRAPHLTYPLVVDLMPGLYVVVSDGLGIVLHVVHNRCGKVLVLRHDVVRPVDTRLALQNVAVVDEQQVVAVLLTLLLDIGVHAYKRSLQGLLLHKIVGKEVPMHVAGLNHLELDGLCRSCHCLNC